MGKADDIRKALADFSGKYGPQNTMLATVDSVDEAEFTCVLQDDDNGELTYPDVRLRPVLDGNESVTVFPKVGTWALAVRIEEEENWMVIAVGEADKVVTVADSEIKSVVGTSEFTIDDGFLMQKGSDTLKQILTLIVEAVQPIVVIYGNNPVYAKLTQALTKINNLLK